MNQESVVIIVTWYSLEDWGIVAYLSAGAGFFLFLANTRVYFRSTKLLFRWVLGHFSCRQNGCFETLHFHAAQNFTKRMRNTSRLSIPHISLRVGDSRSTWKNLSLSIRGSIHYVKYMCKNVIGATLLHIMLLVKFIIYSSS